MFSLLKTPSLRRFFLAHFQSELGTGAAYVALLLVGYERLHSGWAIALVLLANFLPGIVLAAPFGALADRFARRHLAVGADLLRAGAFIALAVTPSFAATIALALLAGVGTAMFRPAVNAALPTMVSPEQRSPATALWGANISIGMTVGPALTALVLLLGPPTVVLAINGATFLISAALLSRVPLGSGAASRVGRDSRPTEESVWSATLEGARSARRIPGVATLLTLCTVSILAGALMNVAEPLLATGPLHAGNAGYSLLVAVYGASMAAGSLALAKAGSSVTGLRRWLLFGLLLQSAGMIGSAIAPSLAVAIASFAVTGVSNALAAGPEMRLFQELAGERLLGRVFGLRDMLANVAYVLAFVGAGVMLDALGVRAVFALGGVALLALTVAGWLRFHPVRSSDKLAAMAEPA
jgi:MFS family permease